MTLTLVDQSEKFPEGREMAPTSVFFFLLRCNCLQAAPDLEERSAPILAGRRRQRECPMFYLEHSNR